MERLTCAVKIMKFNSFKQIFEFLTNNPDYHVNGTENYHKVSEAIKSFVKNSDLTKQDNVIDFGAFGNIKFSYFKMGAIDSLDLFGVDELIIFCLYQKLKNNIKRSIDFGANIGLHSIAMSKMGWTVNAFEPDNNHFQKLKQNLEKNNLSKLVTPSQKAVWTNNDGVNFTRVLGNTTGNHIVGMKSPYGELEHIFVETVTFEDAIKGADFIKLDVEGAEGDLFKSLNKPKDVYKNLKIILEVSENSRDSIFQFAQNNNLQLFCQKLGWKAATCPNDLPLSHRGGSVLCSDNNLFLN